MFGHPIAHSLSPVIHNAAFRSRQWPYFYVPVEVKPEELFQKLDAFRVIGGRGVNLTRPLKEQVLAGLKGLSERARRTGAANTLSWTDDGWLGDNTDVGALYASLPVADTGSGQALVLGAGGAARASAVALADRGYEVTVAARRPEQANWASRVIDWQDIGEKRPWAVIVNATPLGQQGEPPWDRFPYIPSSAAVADWVYRPRQTPLLQAARARGARCIDGLSLLVAQAALAWEDWFGEVGPTAVMEAAVRPWR